MGVASFDVTTRTPIRRVSVACSGSPVRGKTCGSPEQFAYFFVARLRKVSIPLAYSPKWLRSNGTNHFINFRLELGAGGGRAHGHGNDDLCRLFVSERERGCAHRGTRRQTVVNQNHGAPAHIYRRTVVTILSFPTLQFALFFLGHGIDYLIGNVQSSDDLLVHDSHTAGGNRSHGQLLLLRQSKLAHEEDIQGSIKSPGHLKCHRNATSRQGEHNYIAAIGVLLELFGQQAARFGSISKWIYSFSQGFISGNQARAGDVLLPRWWPNLRWRRRAGGTCDSFPDRNVYNEIVMRLSTEVTPGADHAARSASSFSSQERTVPFRMTLVPSTSILVRLASHMTLRRSACSIFCFISDGTTRGFTLMELITPLTPVNRRTTFSASSFWYRHSTSPRRVTQPFATATMIFSAGTAASKASA